MRSRLIIIFILMFLSGCGIFTPRDQFEIPEAQDISENDPFSFSSLLKNSDQHFNRLHPDELFSDFIIYVDVNSGANVKYNKSQMKDRLRQAENEYPGLRVEWSEWNDSTSVLIGDTIYLEEARYSVFLSRESQEPEYFGKSRFTIVRNQIWQIYRWTDIPSGNKKSFFAPQD